MTVRRRALIVFAALVVGVAPVAACAALDDDPRVATPSAVPVATVPTGPAEPPSSPTPAPDPAALKEGGRTATIVMSGDLLWHSGLWESAAAEAQRTGNGRYDFAPLFAGMRPTIESADMAICHEEVPMAPDGTDPSGYPSFGAPQEVADAIAATGWDLCTTSSNHSIDRGFAGIETTLRELDRVGVLHTGTFRSPEERQAPTVFVTSQGVRIAVVSATYGLNGLALPEGREWSVALLDTDDMIARARAARDAGADIVVAAVHAGEEYQSTPAQQQVDAARALVASDAIDLVYGHHAHVVQPWERIDGKWVVYGLGNMIATPPDDLRRSHEGVTSRFTVSERNDGRFAVTRAEYVPTMIDSYWAGQTPLLRAVIPALEAGEGWTDDLLAARQADHDVVFSLGVPEGIGDGEVSEAAQ